MGVVAPEGSRRKIQHYEGGIVKKLSVVEGQVVEKGEPLLVLGDVEHEANHDALIAKMRTLIARHSRLKAEKADEPHIVFPKMLKQSQTGRETMESQIRIFNAKRQEFNTRKRMLLQTLKLINAQVKGYRSLVRGQEEQLAILKEELSTKVRLIKKGYARKTDALRIRKTIADIIGRHGELLAHIAVAQEKQIEKRLEFSALETNRAARIEEELDQVSNDLREVREKLRISEDILQRSIVRAPVTGRVANLRVKTIGGVVHKGQELMDIVPSNERLIVEARISPLDIDNVHEGLEAQVFLTAYSGTNTPRIKGKVLMVSPDRIEASEESSKPFYLAKVTVSLQELKKAGTDVRLAPGMPADVMIVTGERTMMSYLLQPFRDAVQRSFRQSSS